MSANKPYMTIPYERRFLVGYGLTHAANEKSIPKELLTRAKNLSYAAAELIQGMCHPSIMQCVAEHFADFL